MYCVHKVILFSSEYIYKTTAVIQFKMVNLPCVFLHNFFPQKNEVLQQRTETKLHMQSKPVWQRLPSSQGYHNYTAQLVRHAQWK